MFVSLIDSKFGRLEIAEADGQIEYIGDWRGNPSSPSSLTERAASEITEYLEGMRREFTFPFLKGSTGFRRKVYSACIRVPYGCTATYMDIARAIGNEKACRAVGQALKANPVLIAVPCHRIIASDGSLSGYRCGLDMKRGLLELEGITLSEG